MSSASNNKNLEKLTKVVNAQLKKNMHQAFYDVLEAQVRKEEPDYKWLTNLYKEIRDKLTRLMRPTSALYKEIIDTMDLELFEQMIRNKVFTPENMQNLVLYVFEITLRLCSPARDELIKSKREKLIILMKSEDCTIANLVPMFIREVNESIDTIYEDIDKLMNPMEPKDLMTQSGEIGELTGASTTQ